MSCIFSYKMPFHRILGKKVTYKLSITVSERIAKIELQVLVSKTESTTTFLKIIV